MLEFIGGVMLIATGTLLVISPSPTIMAVAMMADALYSVMFIIVRRRRRNLPKESSRGDRR